MIALCLVLLAVAPQASLDEAARALTEARANDALAAISRAQKSGPLTHADHVRLYELLGTAHAYLGNADDAAAAFDALLALDPGHALPYSLSPKVTFIFEKARQRAAAAGAPAIEVSWPRDLLNDAPVPIDVEVVADPKKFLHSARLFWRERGADDFQSTEVKLVEKGNWAHVDLPKAQAPGEETLVRELYLVAEDEGGNEVLVWGDKHRPREVSARYQPPEHWYGKWWVWAIGGVVVAGATAGIVYGATRPPPATISGTFAVGP